MQRLTFKLQGGHCRGGGDLHADIRTGCVEISTLSDVEYGGKIKRAEIGDKKLWKQREAFCVFRPQSLHRVKGKTQPMLFYTNQLGY